MNDENIIELDESQFNVTDSPVTPYIPENIPITDEGGNVIGEIPNPALNPEFLEEVLVEDIQPGPLNDEGVPLYVEERAETPVTRLYKGIAVPVVQDSNHETLWHLSKTFEIIADNDEAAHAEAVALVREIPANAMVSVMWSSMEPLDV